MAMLGADREVVKVAMSEQDITYSDEISWWDVTLLMLEQGNAAVIVACVDNINRHKI